MRCLPILLALLLASCGDNGLTRNFALSRDSGPQTMAATEVPLSMPPELATRPANPGLAAIGPGDATASEQGAGSTGQEALMQAAGPAPPADIRAAINQNSGLVYPDPQFVDRVLNWTPPPGYTPLFVQPSKGWFSGLF
jgi:hypothetical protein